MEETTELIKTTLLTLDNRFVFHPASFSLILLSKKLKELLVLTAMSIGNPKYLPIQSVLGSPNFLSNLSMVPLAMFDEKTTLDFSPYIFWPDWGQNSFNTSISSHKSIHFTKQYKVIREE